MSRAAQAGLGDRFVSLRDASSAPGPRQVALVPGAEVPMLTLDLPKGLRGQSREQVALRQLQDRAGLKSDTIQMRPIHAPRRGDGWSRVMVTDAAQLDGWKSAAGSACRALLPDYLALPTTAGLWTVHGQGDDLLIRLGPDDGFSGGLDVALNILRLQLQASKDKPKGLLLLGDAPPQVAALADEHGVPIIHAPAEAKTLKLAEPKVLGHGELSLDLRQDPQLARSRLRARVLPWRWPVLVGLIALGIWVATEVIQTTRLTDRTEAINTQTQALVREHFVPAGPLLDLRVQVSQFLAERRIAATQWRSEVTALDLFATASGILDDEGVRMSTVTSSPEETLGLVLRVADFAAVDRLADALRSAGLTVDVVESRVTDGASGVRTEMRLTPPAETTGSVDQ